MFSNYDLQAKQILIGNLSLIICCLFYLAWWIIAFKPSGAIKGFKSGWLLIPAFIFGITAVANILRGSNIPIKLISKNTILIGSVLAYVALLLITGVILKRQVTTELILIVGWCMLMFLELNAINSLGYFTNAQTLILLIITIMIAILSLACYLLYYNLSSLAGYIDGMIPLILISIMMIIIIGSVQYAH